MTGVEGNGDEAAAAIVVELAWDVEEVSDDALDAEVSEGRRMSSDCIPAPDGDVVGQLRKENQHLLGNESALVAMG